MDVLDRADLPFPHSLPEFQRLFPDDAACAAYLEQARWGDRPGKGNDKGNVEGVVGYARRNFMVPRPRFASWDTFNAQLEGIVMYGRPRCCKGKTDLNWR